MFLSPRAVLCLSLSLAVATSSAVPTLAQANVVRHSVPKQQPVKPLSKQAMALFDAAEKGNTARVQALLAHGVSAKVQALNGLTPLIIASMMNHPSVVKLLLDRGADVNAALRSGGSVGGSTALIMAAGGSMNIMAGAKTPPAPKGYEGHEIAFMQKHPDQFHRWNQKVDEWSKGYVQIVRLLLDHGADLNAQSSLGQTAIDGASASGDAAEVQLLLDRGARLDLPTHQKDLLDGRSIDGTNGYEALVEATSMHQHSPEVVKLLLAHGAKPNAKSTNDLTPLGRASESGDAQVVRMLLDAGADVNAYDGFGRTAIMLARSNRHADVVTLLQRSGAKNLPEGHHTEVTLKRLGQEPNGDTKMQVTVTPRPADKPAPKNQQGH